MKPKAIRYFSLLFWASVGVSLSSVLIGWSGLIAETATDLTAEGFSQDEAEGIAQVILIGSAAVVLALAALIWFMIARSRIELIKWFLVVLTAASFYLAATDIVKAGTVTSFDLLNLASSALLVIALYFLFQPDAKEWFAEKRHAQQGAGG